MINARWIAPLGEGRRIMLALLAERAHSSQPVERIVPLDELLDVTARHEDGHLTDRTRFLPLSRQPLRALGLLFSAGFTLRKNCDAEAVFEGGPGPLETDDDFLDEVITEQTGTGSYVYEVGIPIPTIGGADEGDVHGLFHPSAKPPLDPGNLPAPGQITVGAAATGFP